MIEYFLSLLAILLSFQHITTCGITTHIEIGHRAASHFEYLLDNKTSIAQAIERYQSAFQAGCPYPDSFYPSICKKGVLHDVSEDTHWVPFLNATIRYIQKTYSKPYNEDAIRLIVFILGVTSHQMADISWHSLGVDQGFLSAMGFVNFHGSFDQAHSVGDIGGDIINQFELNYRFISDLGDWYIPVNDLYNIYIDYYGKVAIDKEDIIECTSILFLGRLGEKLAISLLYADYFNKSTFLANKLNDYFFGGLDDMATWTQLSWNKVLNMIENGLDKCHLDRNIIYVDCNSPVRDPFKIWDRSKSAKSKEPLNRFKDIDVDPSFLNLKNSSKGVYLQASEKYKINFNKNYEALKYRLKTISYNFKNKNENASGIVRSNTSYYLQNDYSSLGWSLASADLNNDNLDDLVIGSPVYSLRNFYQNGAVFGVFSKNNSGLPLNNLDLEKTADFVIFPPAEANNSRFGHSVISLDINQDGYSDLIVSAPSFGLERIQYEGRIFIYYGSNKKDNIIPSVRITCTKHKYCNIGWSLSKGDIDIIATPYAATCGDQCGLVAALFSSKKVLPEELDVDSLWNLNGNMAYEWFGYSIKVKLGMIVVGAPQSRICAQPNCEIDENDIQSVGRVYFYKYPSIKPVLILNGSNEYDQFGYDFDMSHQINGTIIAVSLLTKESKLNKEGSIKLKRAGVVNLIHLDFSSLTYHLVTTIKSDRPYSEFGNKLKFYASNPNEFEDLYIGSQMRSSNILLVDDVQEGVVYKFKGGLNLPMGNITDECSVIDLTPCPASRAYSVFTNNQKQTRFGFNFEFLSMKESNINLIAISSIHASENDIANRLTGKVNIFENK